MIIIRGKKSCKNGLMLNSKHFIQIEAGNLCTVGPNVPTRYV